jgi:methylmalonyl-CoA mutase
MNPDYGSRLQLQKIVMLDLADIVVVNKSDLQRARTAHTEIEQRLEQNRRDQQLVDTVAKRHRDSGVDELFDLISMVGRDRRARQTRGRETYEQTRTSR